MTPQEFQRTTKILSELRQLEALIDMLECLAMTSAINLQLIAMLVDRHRTLLVELRRQFAV